MNQGLVCIGEGIAFAGLCIAAAWLEINDKPAFGLWIIVVIWAFCFGPSSSPNKPLDSAAEKRGESG